MSSTPIARTEIEIANAEIAQFFEMLREAPVDYAHEQQEFNDQFMPAFAIVCRDGSPAMALEIEFRIYSQYVKRWEEESHFRMVYQAFVPYLRELTQADNIDLQRIRSAGSLAKIEKPRQEPLVFFIIHNESELAHIQSLLRYLEAYTEFRNEIDPINTVVVSLDGLSSGLRARLQTLNVPLISLGDHAPKHPNGYVKMLKLATLCRDNQPDAIVFVSAVMWMASYFAARMASTQIWWAMKYHSFSSPDVDGYLCGSPDGEPRQIGGNHWETAPFGGKDWFVPELSNEASIIRMQLGHWKTVFGSIGREEKLRDPAFLDAVCGVLDANPEAVFLWTGTQRDENIQRFFETRQLSERTQFIGWVNTKLYAQVIDVYLDSFPFPGGYTVYESMAAKKPVVMMRLDYPGVGLQNNASPYYFAEHTEGMSGEVQTLFRKAEDRIYFPVASDKSEYIAFACRFADDPALRSTVGHINAQFVDRYLTNRKGMAAGYTSVIKKFIHKHTVR
jgi:glycosyltransferase involved in cell wall biosynthesis